MSRKSSGDESQRFLEAINFAEQLAAKDESHREEMRVLLSSIVEVMDSFDRFFCAVDQDTQPSIEQATSWLQTVRIIAKQLQLTMNRAGLSSPVHVGEIADPRLHQIVEMQDIDNADEGIIVEIVSRGYMWNGELLRQPQVIVGRNVRRSENEGDRH